ncbi:hypothetical protein [Streptomyces sp. NPDC055036]
MFPGTVRTRDPLRYHRPTESDTGSDPTSDTTGDAAGQPTGDTASATAKASFDHYEAVRDTIPARPGTDHDPLNRKQYLLHVVRQV